MTIKDTLALAGGTLKAGPRDHWLAISHGPDWQDVCRAFGSTSPKEITANLIELCRELNRGQLELTHK